MFLTLKNTDQKKLIKNTIEAMNQQCGSNISTKKAHAKALAFLKTQFSLENEHLLSSLFQEDKLNQVYIEDITIHELSRRIKEEKNLQFKHHDCSMFFHSDGEYLYASDVDEPNKDVFGDNDIASVIAAYYLDSHDYVVSLLDALVHLDMELKISNKSNTNTLTLYELEVINASTKKKKNKAAPLISYDVTVRAKVKGHSHYLSDYEFPTSWECYDHSSDNSSLSAAVLSASTSINLFAANKNEASTLAIAMAEELDRTNDAIDIQTYINKEDIIVSTHNA